MSQVTNTAGAPVMGRLLGVIAVAHLAITPWVYTNSTRDIVDAGVVFSVDADPERIDVRGSGFWYATTGWAMLFLSVLIGREERREGTAPAPAVWGLAGLSLWGLLFMPASGFLALLGVASYGGLRRRHTLRAATNARR